MSDTYYTDEQVGAASPAALVQAPTSEQKYYSDADVGATTSRLGHLAAAATDIPNKTIEAFGQNTSAVNEGLNPWSESREAINKRSRDPDASITDQLLAQWDALKLTGSGIAALPSVPASIIQGPARSIIGHIYDAVAPTTTMPEDQKAKLKAAGVNIPTGDEVADTAMMGLAPGRGTMAQTPALLGPRRPYEVNEGQNYRQWQPDPKSTPAPVEPTPGPLGVTQTAGEASQDLGKIQLEQAAARGNIGEPAMERAKAFREQQAQQLAEAEAKINTGFDPKGVVQAENPNQAGEMVSNAVQSAKGVSKANVDDLYTRARSLPGAIDADVFQDITKNIKNELTNPKSGRDQVIIDDDLTKTASKALDYLKNKVGNLRIQNKADPGGTTVAPPGTTLAGVTLEGIDQWRKTLSAYRDAAWGINDTEGRAMSRVMDAFDSEVTKAVNSGAFRGDPAAVQTWNDARAAHMDYRSKYFDQGTGDAVGKLMESITGKKNASPQTPAQVADMLYGANGTRATASSVDLYKRIEGILGKDSPEMSGVKQGLFSRLRETTSGEMGPKQISKNVNEFLSGRGEAMAKAMFTPDERKLLQEYANLQQSLVVPQSGAQWSNNAGAIKGVGDKISTYVAALIGRNLIDSQIPLLGEAVGVLAAKQLNKLGELKTARQVAEQMPIASAQIAKYNKALAAYNSSSTPITRAGLQFSVSNLSKTLGRMGIDDSGDINRADGGRVVVSGINHKPTEAQKAAGNYAMAHVRVHGLNITVENAKDSHRSGIGHDGKEWKVKMPAHYGYVKGTVGADKDHVDVYLGPHHRSARAFIVDQKNAETGKFDEHKAFLGFANRHIVEKIYHAAFSDGKGAQRLGSLTEMPVADFKHWLEHGDTTKPAAGK